MDFGRVYTFKYKAKSKRFDRKPNIIFIKETTNKIIGINLNFIPPKYQTTIINLFNNENINKISNDAILTEKAIESRERLNDQKIAQYLFYGSMKNRKSMLQLLDEQQVKSERMIFVHLQNSFRIYLKANVNSLFYPMPI